MNTTIEQTQLRLKTQDNRMTSNPMFCVQMLVRDVGYDPAYSENKCYRDSANDETVYDDEDPNQFSKIETSLDSGSGCCEQWELFGYKDRWETVMVAFTQGGCEEYLELDGHNVRLRAHAGKVRIYVESFNRCPEMIAIRDHILRL